MTLTLASSPPQSFTRAPHSKALSSYRKKNPKVMAQQYWLDSQVRRAPSLQEFDSSGGVCCKQRFKDIILKRQRQHQPQLLKHAHVTACACGCFERLCVRTSFLHGGPEVMRKVVADKKKAEENKGAGIKRRKMSPRSLAIAKDVIKDPPILLPVPDKSEART